MRELLQGSLEADAVTVFKGSLYKALYRGLQQGLIKGILGVQHPISYNASQHSLSYETGCPLPPSSLKDPLRKITSEELCPPSNQKCFRLTRFASRSFPFRSFAWLPHRARAGSAAGLRALRRVGLVKLALEICHALEHQMSHIQGFGV